MVQVSYEVGDRILDAGVLFEVTARKHNRWGGPVYRIAPVAPVATATTRTPGAGRWLTPRFDTPPARVIDRAALRTLVYEFYDAVRADPELSPVFAARLDGRWPEHLERMVSFWASVILDERSFSGNPMGKHRALVDAEPTHFARWLALFFATTERLFEPDAARVLQGRAVAMARGLSTGLFGQPFDASV